MAIGLFAYPRILNSLTRLLWRPITLAESRELLRRRLGTRERRFLDLARRLIYGYPRSPYRFLLRHAGWEFEDLRVLVQQRGLEGALLGLRDAGVYLSYEEFKGRADVLRGGRTFRFTEKDFDNPVRSAGTEIRSSATRSGGSRVSVAFDYVAVQRAPAWHVTLEALGAVTGPVIIWMPAVTHGGGLMWWLALLHMGRPALRWFSITDPAVDSARHQIMFRTARMMGRLKAVSVVLPEHAPLSEAGTVLDAVLLARARYGTCAVVSSPSAATRLASVAQTHDIDLAGVTFLVGGEPLTSGKAGDIRRTGAVVGSMYVLSEVGAVGGACGDPQAPDDVHFMSDSFGLILHRRPLPYGGEVDALMLTCLLDTAPKIMLNVESDDFGELRNRRCGCVFDELGLHQHLSGVRSFSKLTGEGVTVLGTDCVRILEEVLPREFGGSSVHYQLLETEDEDHLTRLLLVISPQVGSVDEERIRARFIEELQRMGPRGVLPPLWLQADTIRVVRMEPVATAGGKVLPFHTQAHAPLQDNAAVESIDRLVPGS